MNYREQAKIILEEHRQVFERLDTEQIQAFVDAIKAARRIILIGVGREGLSTRAFTMRLMHLGLDSHWIWDETTPSIGEGDLLIATSGCGEIGHIDYVVDRAKANGAKVAVVTGTPTRRRPRRLISCSSCRPRCTWARLMWCLRCSPWGTSLSRHCSSCLT